MISEGSLKQYCKQYNNNINMLIDIIRKPSNHEQFVEYLMIYVFELSPLVQSIPDQ